MEAPVSVLGMEKNKAEGNAHNYLNKVGIGEKWNCFPSELSGGQQQRTQSQGHYVWSLVHYCLMSPPQHGS